MSYIPHGNKGTRVRKANEYIHINSNGIEVHKTSEPTCGLVCTRRRKITVFCNINKYTSSTFFHRFVIDLYRIADQRARTAVAHKNCNLTFFDLLATLDGLALQHAERRNRSSYTNS